MRIFWDDDGAKALSMVGRKRRRNIKAVVMMR
jgi:hypothetical protein